MPSDDRQRVNVILRRLPRGDSRSGARVIYQGRYVEARDVAPVELALGFLGPAMCGGMCCCRPVPIVATSWCGGNRGGPGARACQGCHSLFVLETVSVPDRRGALPTTL